MWEKEEGRSVREGREDKVEEEERVKCNPDVHVNNTQLYSLCHSWPIYMYGTVLCQLLCYNEKILNNDKRFYSFLPQQAWEWSGEW